ncbi:MAG: SpvB/TcaC N-terminal domain-containing protein [Gammaproteobacteria bacterium]
MPTDENSQDTKSSQSIESTAINLPKGGGAIRGIGEKFQANPVTGSGSFSVPLPISPGRGGFQPELSLAYDSGGGNSLFGLGWNTGAPSIKRKTAKQLPRYQDVSESDTFLLAGAEDLVPVSDRYGNKISREVSELENNTQVSYTVFAYRPRIEGLFARIEKWVNRETRFAHWRVTTKDNISSIYGKSEGTKIVDPQNRSHVFEWLIETSYDAKGNRIVYEYKQENSENIPQQLGEKQRIKNATGFANKYLKRVKYSPFSGNAERFHFQLLFDYGEHTNNTPEETTSWPSRLDPFSSYMAGFELRTYRLCRRVLMFHNFPDSGGDVWEPVKSLELSYKETPALSFLISATIKGIQKTAGGYDVKSMPPVEFKYTEPQPETQLKQVDQESLENLPAGLEEANYQWIDLAGEGSPGIITRQAGTIYYKENLGNAKFGAMKPVFTPVALAEDAALQITDLDGDGVNELVVRNDSVSGYYKYAADHWESFTTFKHNPVIDWSDPNLKMLDLTGDGFPDILISEDELFRWYPSEGADGYEASRTVPVPSDDLNGPKVLFSDPEQSIYLADMSGDGLTDIARIRNGEVCYWPNLGYGRFGAKVFMASSPRFTQADEQFNPHYIKIGDIDGSGTSDIMYLGEGAPKYYFNQAGNAWSEAKDISPYRPVDFLSSVAMVDLEGKGTMCLVWSTQLPGQHENQMSYLDLMGTKPHLLSEVKDNMGSVTRLSYVPSTKFYLEDKKQGKPWITKLSFPIHCLETVESRDEISDSRFVTQYKYHHGFFDGKEREFRGFGMVEQWDTEAFAALSDGTLPEASNYDTATHVPPVLTKTWFHTGMYMGRNHVSDFFAGLLNDHDQGEYYREPGLSDAEARRHLLPDTIIPPDLTLDEEREACRALKGSMLRQEVYALDGTDKEAIPYTVVEQNFIIQALQPKGENRYGVFFTHPREVITYHYERNPVDPRTQHVMTLEVDHYGNVLKSLAIGYGRRHSSLPEFRDQEKQTHTLITYTENGFTNAIDDVFQYPDDYRTPLPSETRTYELTGFESENYAPRFSFDEWTRNDFDLLASATEIPYEQTANNSAKQKRLIEHVRSRYRKDDLTAFLPPGEVEPMALPGESYKLAFTPGLLNQVFKRSQDGQPDENLLPDPAPILQGKGADQGGYVAIDGNWWIPSGRSFFDIDADISNPASTASQELSTARAHFYLPRKSTDPFDHSSLVDYDDYDLLLTRTSDALGNTVIADNDYRVLQPWQVTDPNRNRTAVAFDALGMVVASAVMGKQGENLGDLLEDFEVNPTLADLQAFIAEPQVQAVTLLGKATSRIVYDLERFQRTGQPPFAATLARETHFHDPGGDQSRIQISFSYSDGFGREIQKKIQAEAGEAPQRETEVSLATGDIQPGELIRDAQGDLVLADTPQRWVGTGRTVFNNKGKPVIQYEPFFSSTHLYESERDMTDTGVSPVLFYDPLERVVATLHPSHVYGKVVFDPWQKITYDVNDTVAAHGEQTGDPRTDPDISGYVTEYFKVQPDSWQTWYDQRIGNQMGVAERDAAQQAAVHADTPTIENFDSLGRGFMTIASNRYQRNDEVIEEQNANRIELDLEGNQRSVIDAQDRIVMRYDYIMAGPEKDQEEGTPNRIHQISMEAGERWILSDVTGKPIRTWDSRRFQRRMSYDELRRPIGLYVTANNLERLAERSVYGENQGDTGNHRTRVYQVFDSAGIVTSQVYDFKGNLLEGRRDLLPDYTQAVDWLKNPAANDGSFSSRTTYDALNRPFTVTSPDGSVYRPTFNEANLLDKVDVNLHGAATSTAFVNNIDYDAKGQRVHIAYANGAQSSYRYDPQTFRLSNTKTTRPVNSDATASQLFLNTSEVQDLHYTYDPVGNITRIKDAALRTVFNTNQQVEPVSRYTYDAIYRLIETQGREHISQTGFDLNPLDGNYRDHPYIGNRANPNDLQALRNYIQQFEYDSVGNFEVQRHVANGGNWTRRYDYEEDSLIEPGKPSNRLTRTTLGNGTNSVGTYDHDIHGNMTSMPHLPGMVWDFEDQLQQVDLGSLGTAYYVYDAGGQRVRKITESQNGVREKERIYLGGFEIYREFGGGGGAVTLERETLHIMDDQQRIAMVDTRTQGNEPGIPAQLIRYQFGNHLGSASVELDDVGALVTYEEYHPYGTTAFQAGRSAAEVSLKRYRYTGKERDEETGFTYHGARYYAAWLGRWTSYDPLYLKDATNVYIYALNNPIIGKDPTGGPIWLIPVAIYLGYKALSSAGETAVEAGIAKATGDEDFSVGGTFLKNMVVNSTIGLIPGTTEAKIGVKVAVYGTKLALRTTADATLDTLTRDGDFTENLVKSGLGNVGGDVLGEVVKKGGKAVVKRLKGSADEATEAVTKKSDKFKVNDTKLTRSQRKRSPIQPKRGIEKAQEIRDSLNLNTKAGRDRNIAFADVDIKGLNRTELISHSGDFSLKGTSAVPTERLFKTFKVSHTREFDSEVKLLEQVAQRLKHSPTQTGVVRLFSERKVCASCEGVIEQFKEMFPNIRVLVTHGNR